MLLSLLCLVHCLVLPLAIAVLPAATHFLNIPEEVHAMLFFFAAPVSAFAVLIGVRRHGLWMPATTAIVALTLIGLGAFAGFSILLETGISVAGSFLLLIAHALNMRASSLRLRASPTSREPQT